MGIAWLLLKSLGPQTFSNRLNNTTMFYSFRAPRNPAKIATDTIIPMHYFDDNLLNRSVLLYITLRFDQVLDPTKLRDGMEKLIEIGDWRKLGARVRLNVN